MENWTEPRSTGMAVTAVTWAVKVTDWPNSDGLASLVMTVVVGTRTTSWVVAAMLPMKLALVA